MPEWLATTRAGPSFGRCSTPKTSVRNQCWYSGRSSGRNDAVGQVAVEAEVVDLVVAGETLAEERERAGDPVVPLVGETRVSHSPRLQGGARRTGPSETFEQGLFEGADAVGRQRLDRTGGCATKSSKASAVVRGVKPNSRISLVVSTTRPCTNRSSWSRETSADGRRPATTPTGRAR